MCMEFCDNIGGGTCMKFCDNIGGGTCMEFCDNVGGGMCMEFCDNIGGRMCMEFCDNIRVERVWSPVTIGAFACSRSRFWEKFQSRGREHSVAVRYRC